MKILEIMEHSYIMEGGRGRLPRTGNSTIYNFRTSTLVLAAFWIPKCTINEITAHVDTHDCTFKNSKYGREEISIYNIYAAPECTPSQTSSSM